MGLFHSKTRRSARKSSSFRPPKLRLEGLETREMMSADSVFAEFSGWIDANQTEERLPITIAPEYLALGKDRANLSFHLEAVGGTSLNPAAVQILDASGKAIKTTLAKQDLPGGNDSLVIAQLPVGNYTLVIAGQAGTKGKFGLDVALVGDANGDHRVDRVDGNLIRAAYGSVRGDSRYIAAADADQDGRLGSFDLMQWQVNSSDTPQVIAPSPPNKQSLGQLSQTTATPLVGGADDRIPAVVPTAGYKADAPMRFFESKIGWVQPLSTPSPEITSGVFQVGGGSSPQAPSIFKAAAVPVPGDANTITKLDFTWEYREAGYNNTLGYYLTDASGNVNGVSPSSQAAYKAAVQSVGQTIFSSGQTAGATKTIYLTGSTYIAFYLIQDGLTNANWWFSINSANADAGYAHFQVTTTGNPGHRADIPSFKVEDLRNSDTGIPNPRGIPNNDADFNDVVFSMAAESHEVFVDLDIDSDNSGAIEHSLAEEGAEDTHPSKLVLLNGDDDNGNDIADYLDIGEFRTPGGVLVEDDDFVPFTIGLDLDELDPSVLDGYRIRLERSDAFRFRIWEDRSKLVPVPVNDAEWALDDFPETLYIEAVNVENPSQTVTAKLLGPNDEVLDQDTVNFTIIGGNLQAFRSPGLASPALLLPELEVPADQEETAGVGLRRNGDDDNGNSSPDYLDTSAGGSENDLARLLAQIPEVAVAGIEYVLRAGNELAVWTSNKGQALIGFDELDDGEVVIAESGSAYVEWWDVSTAAANALITLFARDTVNNVEIPLDTVKYFPFTSVVIGLSGEQTESSGGNPSQSGINTMIQELYADGYNVAFYNDDDAQSNPPNNPSPVLQEIIRHAEGHGITDIAIFGHSHGGGATYNLTEAIENQGLDTQYGLAIKLTAYLDAIEQDSDGDPFPERRRPRGSEFHVNLYQLTPTEILKGYWLIDLQAQDIEEEVTDWNGGIRHGNIDDDPDSQDIILEQVHSRLLR